MTKIKLINQHHTHFATLDMPELPRVDDTIEIGFPDEQVVKNFVVERVVHQMIQLPRTTTKYYDDIPVDCRVDPPWRCEFRLHGHLFDPKALNPKCICLPNQEAVKCPKHGEQSANRELCPRCKKHVLGYCAQGEYCTSDDCKYVA